MGDPLLVVPKGLQSRHHAAGNRGPPYHLTVDVKSFGENPQIAFPKGPMLRRPLAERRDVVMSHNVAITYHNNSFVFVGGTVQHAPSSITSPVASSPTATGARKDLGTTTDSANPHQPREKEGHHGIWVARSPTLWFAASQKLLQPARVTTSAPSDEAYPISWRKLEFIIGGRHEGCVERRDASRMTWLVPSVCEYDGRLSIVYHAGRYLLYARANPAEQGQRYVQLTTSLDSYTWSPFRMIRIDGYKHSEGNIYFWAVQVNPVHSGSLIALFPLVHRLHGCIGMAFSVDGLSWSPMRVALTCGAFGDRTLDHPASPAMVRGRGAEEGLVHLYVQHGVPSIGLDRMTPWSLYKETVLLEPRSTVFRYSLGSCDLVHETRLALKALHMHSLPEPCSEAAARSQADRLCASAAAVKDIPRTKAEHKAHGRTGNKAHAAVVQGAQVRGRGRVRGRGEKLGRGATTIKRKGARGGE